MTSSWASSVGGARARDTFGGLTDEAAAIPLVNHRRPGTPFARVLVDLVVHTNEHAAQILQHRHAGARPATT